MQFGWKVFYFECEERIENRKDGWEKEERMGAAYTGLEPGTSGTQNDSVSLQHEALGRQNKFFTAIFWACGIEVDVLFSWVRIWEHVKMKLINISDCIAKTSFGVNIDEC